MRFEPCHRALIALITLVGSLTLASPAVRAADAKAPPKGNVLSLGKGNGAGDLLTRDELRQCLQQQAALKPEAEQVRSSQAELEAEKARLASDEAALQAERATVDATRQESVDAFNARLKALGARLDEYRGQALRVNEAAQAYNERQQAWAGGCASRAYSEIDYYAIQRGK